MPIVGNAYGPLPGPESLSQGPPSPACERPESLPPPAVRSFFDAAQVASASPSQEPTTGQPVPGRQAFLEVQQGLPTSIHWTLRHSDGAVVSLAPEVEDGDPPVVWMDIAEVIAGRGRKLDGEIYDQESGVVSITASDNTIGYPGLYRARICAAHPDTPAIPRVANTAYLLVLVDEWSSDTTQRIGPPPLSDIRAQLRDTHPAESFLLESSAFADEEIAYAMTQPVRYWNEVPPPIGQHTTHSFLYRYHWTRAICGHLFAIAAEQQRRNNLPYAAGGTQVNDQGREQNYTKASEALLQEYRDFVLRKKVEINIDGGFGGVSSPYGR